MKRLRDLFLEPRLFVLLGVVALGYVTGAYVPPAVELSNIALLALTGATVLDAVLLLSGGMLSAGRTVPVRFSNGDPNPVFISVVSRYRFPVRATVLDELPVQLQVRDARLEVHLQPGDDRLLRYEVRPVRRGVYQFGQINLYARSPLGLIARRFRCGDESEVAVYPGFLQMRRYELLAASNRLNEVGVKRVRRIGHTMEFEHIREYVHGDDPRSVNWQATARRASLMVNQYQDEQGQPVYCLLNTGRVMRMPFEGMTLLDYAINAALVLANTALVRHDRAGVITFSDTVHATLPAESRPRQIQRVQELLYAVEEEFKESDYAALVTHVRRHVKTRSLLLLFTNFEAASSMRRQMPYLRLLGRDHILVVVFFQNTELSSLLHAPAESQLAITTKAVAEKFVMQKREIVAELRRAGILSVLAPPQALTAPVVNQYLELKARGAI